MTSWKKISFFSSQHHNVFFLISLEIFTLLRTVTEPYFTAVPPFFCLTSPHTQHSVLCAPCAQQPSLQASVPFTPTVNNSASFALSVSPGVLCQASCSFLSPMAHQHGPYRPIPSPGCCRVPSPAPLPPWLCILVRSEQEQHC